MPERPVLSEKGKAALAVLRDTGFVEEGASQRADALLGVCALFHEPLDAQGDRLVSSLSPVYNNPRLAIEDFMAGVTALEKVLKPYDTILRTNYGPLEGLSQAVAQQRMRDAIDTLKVEIQAQFGMQYDEIARFDAARKAQR